MVPIGPRLTVRSLLKDVSSSARSNAGHCRCFQRALWVQSVPGGVGQLHNSFDNISTPTHLNSKRTFIQTFKIFDRLMPLENISEVRQRTVFYRFLKINSTDVYLGDIKESVWVLLFLLGTVYLKINIPRLNSFDMFISPASMIQESDFSLYDSHGHKNSQSQNIYIIRNIICSF